jgi:Fis family transcriptional regulator, factor for inversion stimulation protein
MILEDVSPQIPLSSTAPPLHDGWPTLETLSRRYIDRALHRTKGNKTRAAELLGIDRRTLNRILGRERTKADVGPAR